MRASGDQLRQIGSLIETGAIRPVLDQVFPFESTKEAMAYVEQGRAKGKVVVVLRTSRRTHPYGEGFRFRQGASSIEP